MTKAAITRQFIIEKSAPIFNVKGIAATAMSDIMEATNLSKGSLYVHFENKEELSYCAVDYYLNSFMGKLTNAITKFTTPKEQLTALVEFLSTPQDTPLIGGCPVINFGMEADDTNPVILQRVNKTVKSMQQKIASLVEKGIRAGEFRKNWDAKEFAIKSYAMIEGGILIARITGNRNNLTLIGAIIKKEIQAMSA